MANIRPIRDRMASPETRQPPPRYGPPEPIERVLVQPPPQMIPRCPRCGAARPGQWIHAGMHPRGEGARKTCSACGCKALFSADYQTIRIIG